MREKRGPPRAGRHVLAGPGLALLPSLFLLTGALVRGGGVLCGRRGAFDARAPRVLSGRSGRPRSRAERADRLVVFLVLPPERSGASTGAPSRPRRSAVAAWRGGGGLLIQPKEVLIICMQILHSVQDADFALCTGCRFCTLYRMQILHSDCGFALESCGILEVCPLLGEPLPSPPPIGYPGSLPAGESSSSVRAAGGGQTKSGPPPRVRSGGPREKS